MYAGSSTMRILNICIFTTTSENGALILCSKNYFENLKKIGKHFNIFDFFTKILNLCTCNLATFEIEF